LFFIYNLIFFGLGEEAGWRGFALPRFQEKMSPLRAGILLTLFWALWHLPLFLYRPGYLSMGVAGAVGWVLSLLTGSILLTWFYNSSKGSILICAVFHTAMDVVFTAEAAGKNIINYTGFLITVWGILTVFILLLENRNGVK
ncbi:MAG TPA: CPBP family intramembrane metalloprotease, partial [Leptospiraceae bacterium]|nr:CPBP family intramembrane metalloprotease [Leptospiraceae bacterium]